MGHFPVRYVSHNQRVPQDKQMKHKHDTGPWDQLTG